MKPRALIFRKAAIIGVGVIGGSLGMALQRWALADKITGVDTDKANLEAAVSAKAIHEGMDDLTKAVEDADLVVLATPVRMIGDVLAQIGPFLKKGCIVTDVGSTKAEVVRLAEKTLPEHVHFIGGHPMTGSEIFGVKGADSYLFENAVYVLTPSSSTDPSALAKLTELIEAIGGKVIKIAPEEHDLMVAMVSHLPHLTAAALVNTAAELEVEHEGMFLLAAGGFRDTTRVASGNTAMWRDICLSNREHIVTVLDRFINTLEKTRDTIVNCDKKMLDQEFDNARRIRNSIPAKLRGYHSPSFEIVANIPDRPGAISVLTGILGKAGININEIEILRVREGEGGTLRIAVSSAGEQEAAVHCLNAEGIFARKR